MKIFLSIIFACGKVQVGNDQEKAQSEKDSHSKIRGGGGSKTMNTFSKPNEQLFPNRWPLSYLNLTKIGGHSVT